MDRLAWYGERVFSVAWKIFCREPVTRWECSNAGIPDWFLKKYGYVHHSDPIKEILVWSEDGKS